MKRVAAVLGIGIDNVIMIRTDHRYCLVCITIIIIIIVGIHSCCWCFSHVKARSISIAYGLNI